VSISQALYFRAPVPIQNLLVSAYGLARRRKRYGGSFTRILAEIEGIRSMSVAEIDAIQRRRLRAIVSHAVRTVPYYRDLFRQLGLAAEVIREQADLQKLPVLTKKDVQEHLPRLREEGRQPYWLTETSGSTGTPLTVALDRYTYQLSMALVVQLEDDLGIRMPDRRVTLAGRLVRPVADDRPPFWRYNLPESQMLLSAYHMSGRNLPLYVEAIQRFQPVEIIGYPSAIYVLAEHVRRANQRLQVPLKAVVTNSETLFAWQREVIEDAFQAPAIDYYGTAESVVFAPQCRHRRYHANPLMGISELVDGDDPSPGAPRRLVCTTLTNRAMPLLRYEIGDLVEPLPHRCECGQPGVAWASVAGRKDDVVTTPEGHQVGRLDHVFKGVRQVRESQIAQTAPDRLVIRVVPDGGYESSTEARLVGNLRERVGNCMRIDVELVPAIVRTSRGKFKGVVREF